MKKNDDINFLRASLNDEITLPESLSEENIASLVAGEKIRRNKQKIYQLNSFIISNSFIPIFYLLNMIYNC